MVIFYGELDFNMRWFNKRRFGYTPGASPLQMLN